VSSEAATIETTERGITVGLDAGLLREEPSTHDTLDEQGAERKRRRVLMREHWDSKSYLTVQTLYGTVKLYHTDGSFDRNDREGYPCWTGRWAATRGAFYS
jgi:hypothetical protein